MPDFLKGNYELTNQKKRRSKHNLPKNLTETFEEQALAKLGGSMCFVMKGNTFVWSGEDSEKAGS